MCSGRSFPERMVAFGPGALSFGARQGRFMCSGKSFPERMNAFAPARQSITARAKATRAVQIDVMRSGKPFPERLNRFTTAAATIAARRASIADDAATIQAVAMCVSPA
jgi:hypothetical protein